MSTEPREGSDGRQKDQILGPSDESLAATLPQQCADLCAERMPFVLETQQKERII